MGWLLAAAVVLTLLAGWCATAEAALARVSRAGAKELGRGTGEGSTPLQVVLADVWRYLAVLLLARIAAELSAVVLVTVVLLHCVDSGSGHPAARAAAAAAPGPRRRGGPRWRAAGIGGGSPGPG
jgi:CBS domain containing-hemolysin-like protein